MAIDSGFPVEQYDALDTQLAGLDPLAQQQALQSFLRAPSVGSDGPGSLTIVVQDFNIRSARAAIAKATGE
jgi:hypothetical protein